MTARLQSACIHKHTLVPIVGAYWACECPSVYLRQHNMWLEPARLGLLDEIVHLAETQGGIAAMARRIEHAYQAEQEARKKLHKKERKTRAVA